MFAALTDPHLTTRFWFTKSTGPMVAGAQLTWTWEMYRVSSAVSVTDVEPDQRVRFTWSGYDPAHPTTVEFRFVPWAEGTAGDTAEGTYVLVTETGFSGDADTLVGRVIDFATGSPSCSVPSRLSSSTTSRCASSWTRTRRACRSEGTTAKCQWRLLESG